MTDDILEFCKECGMEFPFGFEEICSLCGNEVELEKDENPIDVVGQELDESERCAVCKQWYEESDEWFWDYWHDFDSPAWLSIDDVWCTECILKRFKKDHPDFSKTGLEPDTYLVWKDALDSGVDLGPKLFDIEMSNAIRRLVGCAVNSEDIIRWLDSDCPIDEAEEWTRFFDDFYDAMAWRDAGFKTGEDDIEGWLGWGCTADEAADAKKNGTGYAPHPDFKKFGVTFSEAVFLDRNEFEPHEDEGSEYFIGTWLPSGLSWVEIVKLRDGIKSMESEFAAIHSSNQSRLKYEEWTYDFWEALPRQFEHLKLVGLPVTALNLKKYWGLTNKEILKVIDAGGAPGVAADAIRQGASVGKLGIIERLIEMGVASSTATLLAKRGFLIKHLKQIEKKKDLSSTFEWIAAVLASDGGIKVDEALVWLEAEARVSEVKMWRHHGFSAQEAAQWSNEGFNAETAKRWRDSGASSAAVAKRRRDAGLNP